MTQDKQKDIGALWKKQGPKAEYQTGKITVEGKTNPIVVFGKIIQWLPIEAPQPTTTFGNTIVLYPIFASGEITADADWIRAN